MLERIKKALHRHRPDYVVNYADRGPQQAWCRCGEYMGQRQAHPGVIESRQPRWTQEGQP